MHSMMGDWWPQRSHFQESMSVPAPLTMVGIVVAFMLGMMLGLMKGKTAGMMMASGHGMHHRGMWKKMHHHHGMGMPSCCSDHGQGPGWAGEQAAPGAQQGEHRNEGE